jgi:hypothetical protein
MRTLFRLAVLGLAAYGAKALYDRYGSSAPRTAGRPADEIRWAPGTSGGQVHEAATTSGVHAPGRVDPNSPAAQADDAVAVAMATPPRLS